MISLDTNVIVRFYVDDPDDADAAHQRPLARKVFESSGALFVPLTVVLELEWVLRAFYGFSGVEFAKVVHHLSGLPHVTLESHPTVLGAVDDHVLGLDFADALHLRASRQCESLVTFDERKFARRAKRLGLQPPVVVPSAKAGA
jgi:predicted nucleic-acid-binding protein